MADVAIKSLADGQLAATKGTIYTTPAATQTIVDNIVLVNSDSSARAVNLYFKASGGTSRRLTPKDYSLGIGASLEYDKKIMMEAADILEGDAAAATVVDYCINGVENS